LYVLESPVAVHVDGDAAGGKAGHAEVVKAAAEVGRYGGGCAEILRRMEVDDTRKRQ
jgi:hypothetical protein